jgi:hypothetical protein
MRTACLAISIGCAYRFVLLAYGVRAETMARFGLAVAAKNVRTLLAKQAKPSAAIGAIGRQISQYHQRMWPHWATATCHGHMTIQAATIPSWRQT